MTPAEKCAQAIHDQMRVSSIAVHAIIRPIIEQAIREAQEAARGDEREACARLADRTSDRLGNRFIAAAIRARGESTPEPTPLKSAPMTWDEFDRKKADMVAEVRRSEKLTVEDMATRVSATPERQEPERCQIRPLTGFCPARLPIRMAHVIPHGQVHCTLCCPDHPSSSTPSEGK